MTRELAGELQQVTALAHEVAHSREQRGHVALRHGAGDAHQHGAADLAQQVLGGLQRHLAVTKHGELLQCAQRIAHAAARMAHHQLERGLVVLEALLTADVLEVGLDVRRADGAEVEALHAREDGLGNLLRVRCAQYENHVLRRLLKRLQQRVERRRREHVDLVDDIELVIAAHGGIVDAIDDLFANVVHAGPGRGVQLVHVRVLARRDQLALLARPVRQMPRPLLAHQGLCQDARHGRLARTTRPAEQVRVARAALQHGVLKRRNHMLLANYLVKRLRTILPVQRFHCASRAPRRHAPGYAAEAPRRGPCCLGHKYSGRGTCDASQSRRWMPRCHGPRGSLAALFAACGSDFAAARYVRSAYLSSIFMHLWSLPS